VTLRSYLVGLTLATLLPVALFAGTVGYFLVQEQRETFRTGAEARTLAVLTAVDTELEASISTLNSGRAKPDTIISVEAGAGSAKSRSRTAM